MNPQLGDLVKDRITGYEGIVTIRSEYLNKCIRIALQSRKLKDGLPVKEQFLDEEQLEVVASKVVSATPARNLNTVELGDLCEDTITNFTGVVVSLHCYLNGNVRADLQPKELKDGVPVESQLFEVERINILEKADSPTSKKEFTGGPRKPPAVMTKPGR